MKQPVLVWHVTPSRLVSRILMEGLMPSHWTAGSLGPQRHARRHHARISVCTDSLAVLDVARRFMSRAVPERHALLELALPPGWVHVDDVTGETTVEKRVMPRMIRILVPDLDEWDGTYPDGFAPAGWRRKIIHAIRSPVIAPAPQETLLAR